jgi:probable phosphoglycerate mutase
MRITLVRHAQSTWNAEDRWQGQSDVPLSTVGREEAACVGVRLAGERFDRIIASDLSRAMDTARAIAGARAIESDTALREMHLGSWCGLPHAEVATHHAGELRALARGEDVRIGGTGETIGEFSARVLSALEAIEQGPQGHVLVVTHGGVIRAVLMALLNLAGRERPLIGSGNTGITRLRFEDGKRTLAVYNDQAHLALDHEEGDRIVHGLGAGSELADALSLIDAPLDPLNEDACAVLRAPEGKPAQLRRYGVVRP